MSVTSRLDEVRQPRGGFIKKGDFIKRELSDGKVLHSEENLNPGLVGSVVDYLTRFIICGNVYRSFEIPLKGLEILEAKETVNHPDRVLVDYISDLSDSSIIAACKLTFYEVFYRNIYYGNRLDESSRVEPDNNTIENIRLLVERSVDYFKSLNVPIDFNVTFDGGYTELISCGDADYMTKDTIWDMKVSATAFKSEYSLQLAIYYLLGKHSGQERFKTVCNIGIFNPRENATYLYDMRKCPSDTLKLIERYVIGYDITCSSNEVLIVDKKVLDEIKSGSFSCIYVLKRDIEFDELTEAVLQSVNSLDKKFVDNISCILLELEHVCDQNYNAINSATKVVYNIDDLKTKFESLKLCIRNTHGFYGDTRIRIELTPRMLVNGIMCDYEEKYLGLYDCKYYVRLSVIFSWDHIEKNIVNHCLYLSEEERKAYCDLVGFSRKIKDVLNPINCSGSSIVDGVLTIPSGTTEIPMYCYKENTTIKRVVINNELVSIEAYAFLDCSSLEELIIPDTVKKIGKFAFYRCKGLKKVKFNAKIKKITQGLFNSCESLERLVLGQYVKEIGKGAFRGCKSLTDISFNDGMEVIGVDAFRDCTSLTKIVLPDSVKLIDSNAFNSCINLTEISVPSTCVISDSAFANAKMANILVRR